MLSGMRAATPLAIVQEINHVGERQTVFVTGLKIKRLRKAKL